MKNRIKSIIAFAVLVGAVLNGLVLSALDRKTDVYPSGETKIRLYGETHGSETHYDIEFDLWKSCYDEGYRALFVELPYYTAEYLNLWMRDDSDEIIDQIFEDIQGTQSGNEHYYEFWHDIKAHCPETVLYGTDVGHQYDVTGARYLAYLSEQGLDDSGNYRLAEECINQGIEYRSDDSLHNGVSSVRESYLVSNFIDAYSRCGTEKIMGIYGSYHVDLSDSDLMAGRLLEHYGDVISSVKISSMILSGNDPYRPGFCVTGLVFLLMLFVPNIYWAKKAKPEGYDETSLKENRVLLVFERVGEALVTCSLLIFPAINPHLIILPEGVLFDWKMLLFATSFTLMILYECYWIGYFRSQRRAADMYSSFAGFPLAGATLPVLAVLILGIYSLNLIVIGSAVILGIGHIGIHMTHCKEASLDS